jgi:hypothetical protein
MKIHDKLIKLRRTQYFFVAKTRAFSTLKLSVFLSKPKEKISALQKSQIISNLCRFTEAQKNRRFTRKLTQLDHGGEN